MCKLLGGLKAPPRFNACRHRSVKTPRVQALISTIGSSLLPYVEDGYLVCDSAPDENLKRQW